MMQKTIQKIIYIIYIFGHSLDVTDRDVLRDLILNDNVMTTIFYRNKVQYGQQIANLVKVIGQDELIKKLVVVLKLLSLNYNKIWYLYRCHYN